MATTISRDDAKACFRCDLNPPSFRLISLERYPNECRELQPDCNAGLFCERCLRIVINDHIDAFAQSKLPLGTDESTDRFIRRQVGFVVVPLMLDEKESELLVDEIETEWLEAVVNQSLSSAPVVVKFCSSQIRQPDQASQLPPDYVRAPNARTVSSSKWSYGPQVPEPF